MKAIKQFKLSISVFAVVLFMITNGMICFKKNTMPAATQTGANTFGCYVNGGKYIPNVPFILINLGPNPKALQTHYYEDFDSNSFHFFVFTQDRVNKPFRHLNIMADGFPLEEKTYDIADKASPGSFYAEFYYDYLNTYLSSSVDKGQITITHLDKEQHIISGTFWFKALNPANGMVEVSDGRFDLKY